MSGVFVLLLDGRQVRDQATGSNLCTGYMCMRNVRVFARIFMDSYLGARKVAVCVNRARVILPVQKHSLYFKCGSNDGRASTRTSTRAVTSQSSRRFISLSHSVPIRVGN